MHSSPYSIFFFFFNDTATTEIYTLSLHDALPICIPRLRGRSSAARELPRTLCAQPCSTSHAPRRRYLPDIQAGTAARRKMSFRDRKSTRLNSSHGYISYAVFCLKKKNDSASVPTT